MNQLLIAAFIVAAALAYSVWVLMPASWRRATSAWFARHAARSGLAQDRTLAIQAKLERASACSECASCKGCASSSPASR